jgi:hypothetical protein
MKMENLASAEQTLDSRHRCPLACRKAIPDQPQQALGQPGIHLDPILQVFATPTVYGPEGSTGGYTNFKLGPNTHRVVFRANGFTSNAGCENMALLRGAELVLIDGCNYFEVLQGGTQVNIETTYLPGETNVQTFMAWSWIAEFPSNFPFRNQ